jgi:hypothetical protein
VAELEAHSLGYSFTGQSVYIGLAKEMIAMLKLRTFNTWPLSF